MFSWIWPVEDHAHQVERAAEWEPSTLRMNAKMQKDDSALNRQSAVERAFGLIRVTRLLSLCLRRWLPPAVRVQRKHPSHRWPSTAKISAVSTILACLGLCFSFHRQHAHTRSLSLPKTRANCKKYIQFHLSATAAVLLCPTRIPAGSSKPASPVVANLMMTTVSRSEHHASLTEESHLQNVLV